MGIKSGVRTSTGTIDIGTSPAETEIFTVPNAERYKVEACSIHNTTGSAIVVKLYNTTSNLAGGKEVANISVPANESEDVSSIIGEGYPAGEILLIQAAATGLNVTTTVTVWTGTSV